MASLKDTEQLTGKLDDLVGQLRSELSNGDVDFQKIVSLADELGERADGVAETFNNLNDTLMQGLEKVKSGAKSRSSSSSSSEKSGSRTTTRSS
jgi:methyl-accepting chemotaxis protein